MESPSSEDIRAFPYLMDYVEGKLSPVQVADLEARMAQDPALEAQVDEIHAAWLRNPDFRQEVAATHQQFQAVMGQERLRVRPKASQARLWLLAAAVAFLVALGGLWLVWLRPTGLCAIDQPQQLAQEVGVYQQQFLMMGSRADRPNLAGAFQAYDQGEYAQAATQMRALVDTSHRTLAARELTLCLGISYFMTQQYDQAMPYLSQVAGYREARYGFEATWYQALIGHAQGADVRPLLRILASQPNHYQAAAAALLDCW